MKCNEGLFGPLRDDIVPTAVRGVPVIGNVPED
jgi:hypothetical protein